MTRPAAAARADGYAGGLVMVCLAGFCLSLGGIMVRQMEGATGWQILFYRSISMLVALLAVMAVQYRGRLDLPFRAMGWGGVIAGVSLAISMIAYLFAIILTTVANAMFIISAGPFFSAVLSWLLLRERVRPLTCLAIAVALLGMGLMFADGIANGRMLGMVVAVICVITFAAMVVLLRRFRGVDMLPALATGAAITIVVTGFIAGDLRAPRHDILLAFSMGIVQTGAGAVFIMLGARRVPAAQVSLLLLTEPILAPLWVWIFVDEAPTATALVGGLIVLGAVIAQAIAGVMWERRTAPATA